MALKRLMLILLVCAGLTATAQRPEDWVGEYKGEMEWYLMDMKMDNVPVTVTISTESPAKLRFKYVYLQKTDTIIKDYFLVKDSANANVYYFDEQNGILLKAQYIGNKLYCNYEVDGMLYYTQNYLENNRFVQELSYGPTTTTPTGGTGDLPLVNCFITTGLQKFVLSRK